MTTTFTSVLVANRGEIARRVIAAAHARGLRAVAVYSDADADSPHVAEADEAVRLPGETPADTYLRSDLIIGAARATGAEAVHPGYGFLSENADFAAAVGDAGLVWIGPSPEAITAMGSKVAAKERLLAAGVPMLTNLTPDQVADSDFPVLVKASAGGGGRGMRVVRDRTELPEALAAAEREAKSAFGDGTVFCERYLERGRHIEVQVMADTHGTVWAVGERECSVQRRHQKVVEEAPSPLVERRPDMRDKLFQAATDAAKAIGYTGAGTVEFLATDAGEFFFLEVNTRLQVEHPVTEATTGLDLVGLQFDVAAGVPLPSDLPPATKGAAVEVRLYAEDPAHDWRPAAGVLRRFSVPGVVSEFEGPSRPGVRLDSSVAERDAVVEVFYDPMLAKVIAWAPTRTQALAIAESALRRSEIHGLTTNRDLLVRILADTDFRAGDFATDFLTGDRLEELSAPLLTAEDAAVAARAAAAVLDRRAAAAGPVPYVPAGWRNVGRPTYTREFAAGEESITPDAAAAVSSVAERDGGYDVAVERHGIRSTVAVTLYEDDETVAEIDTPRGGLALTLVNRLPSGAPAAAAGSLLAPMPGVITRIGAEPGDTVTAGTPVLWMEAMKMEHAIAAPADGVVASIDVTVGQNISAGAVVAVLDNEE
ncbi:biotin carboxylase N-terminal domain-containing protein [Tsukamurella sp. 8F]|uniref:acetyl/propionyl/methylcrotonyl-CoA carboxylase subunit alpha n=1 Tax=unclassified Tsukamurella TaxID=2633480 RepID=UPI0023B99CCC|nr:MULTISPECIES: biotin carboxylase N-terminal domain-containing protein [unclassified Tsukamurella]MDF0532112.1 biotin carboxylase N-terminal domain-containing protein [Tsukamurella sp. 8J]MDF0589210.1 biotin carboxylase N-terminal domain-containing protein [Tsukamurella sp. 8F]